MTMPQISDAVSRSLIDLESMQAIAQQLAAHSRGIDRADFPVLAGAYHADATVDYGFFVGAASDLAGILAGAQKGQPVTLHCTCNRWIKVDGSRGRSESYVLAYMESPASGGVAATQRWIGGRYLDRHEQRDGQWRLTHRTYVMDWNINRPSTADWPDPGVNFANFVPRGGHGAADAGNVLLTLAVAELQQSGVQTMSNTITEAQIDAVLSKQALHELCMGYARAADRADAALMRSLFHDDAMVISGVVNGSGADFATGVTAFIAGNLQRCFHSVANEWFQVYGDDAVGETYVIAYTSANGSDTMTGGRYIDAFQRRKGVWKFKTRSFVVDYSATHPTTHSNEGLYAGLKTHGCFGPADPVYAFWKEPA
jgi:hypothetical protein